MPTFGERLRELREKADLSQPQLAEASGLPVGSIRNYEQGIREPYWAVTFRPATGLRVSADVFADRTSNIKQTPPARRPSKTASGPAKVKRTRGRPRKET